jgi:hypothetical protein
MKKATVEFILINPEYVSFILFASWLEADSRGRAVVHATFQLTGDCPGFYVSPSVEDMMPILKEYSKKIYDYNMATSRTTRENYGSINMVDLKKAYTGEPRNKNHN